MSNQKAAALVGGPGTTEEVTEAELTVSRLSEPVNVDLATVAPRLRSIYYLTQRKRIAAQEISHALQTQYAMDPRAVRAQELARGGPWLDALGKILAKETQ